MKKKVLYPRAVTSRVTAKKFGGDDSHSWAIFIDNRPWLTGLTKSEVSYYRTNAHRKIAAEMGGVEVKMS